MKAIWLPLAGLLTLTSSLTLAQPPARDMLSLGAVGDGEADDTVAIQEAIASGLGGIRFPKGVYRLTHTVVVDLDKVGFTSLVGDGTARIVMAGPGPAFRFVGTHGGTADPDSFSSNVWARQRMPAVDGLEIIGGHPEANGIEATGTMQLTLTRLTVRGAKHAIHLLGRNRNVLIADCHFYHNRGAGVFYDDVNLHQSNISACHISYNGGGGIVSRGGNVRNIHISGCDIESNMATNAPPTANVLLDCTGGVVGEVAITGCTIQHNSRAPDSANVRVIGAGTDAGLLRRAGSPETREGHITITGNVFSDVRVNVHLRQVRGVTLTGNTFWMGYDHDLVVEQSSNVVVGPNNFDRNPRYNYGTSLEAKGGLVFRDSRDCILNGLLVHGVRRQAAAVTVSRCHRFNILGCSILDSDGIGLLLEDTTKTRVAQCLIRDDRQPAADVPPLQVIGGEQNTISHP